MNVSELMTHAPAVCTTSDHLTRAAQIMWERDCGAVPVIDDAGKLAGIVTDRDICMAAYTQGRALHEIPVANAMSKSVFTIGPDAAEVAGRSPRSPPLSKESVEEPTAPSGKAYGATLTGRLLE